MSQGPVYVANASDIGSSSSVTVTASALPDGASTSAKQDLQATSAKQDLQATAAKQDTINTTLGTLATSANQTTANSSLSTIATNSAKKYEVKNQSAITPNDVTELDYDYMYVGGTMATDGTVAPVDVAVTFQDDSSATFYNVPNGSEFIFDIKKILATGTSAGANVVCGRIDRTS